MLAGAAAAGPAFEDGLEQEDCLGEVAAVWESKEHADRFLHEKLMPSMPVEGGFAGQPEERTAEIINLATA